MRPASNVEHLWGQIRPVSGLLHRGRAARVSIPRFLHTLESGDPGATRRLVGPGGDTTRVGPWLPAFERVKESRIGVCIGDLGLSPPVRRRGRFGDRGTVMTAV